MRITGLSRLHVPPHIPRNRGPLRASLLLAVLATPANACQEETGFSCSLGEKVLEVCLWQGDLIDSHGRVGLPELTIAAPLDTVDYSPWPGIGRAIWVTVTFLNEGIAHDVRTSVDKMDKAAALEGGVNVLKVEAMPASLTCDPGRATHGLEGISGMKAAIGEYRDFDNRSWGSCG